MTACMENVPCGAKHRAGCQIRLYFSEVGGGAQEDPGYIPLSHPTVHSILGVPKSPSPEIKVRASPLPENTGTLAATGVLPLTSDLLFPWLPPVRRRRYLGGVPFKSAAQASDLICPTLLVLVSAHSVHQPPCTPRQNFDTSCVRETSYPQLP